MKQSVVERGHALCCPGRHLPDRHEFLAAVVVEGFEDLRLVVDAGTVEDAIQRVAV